MSGIQQLQEENNMGFGAEETENLLDSPNLVAAMKKMLELQIQVMVIPMVKRVLGPMMENMVRKVVKEEFEQAQERFFTKEKWKSGDEGHITQVRQLELHFLEQVADLIYTGKEIKGGGGNHLVVQLVDPLTGSRVSSGPEASAKIELKVLSKYDDVDGHFKQEDSEDMGRPLLSRNHVKLKDGIAVLDDIKFKHKSKWTKNCKVILVAQANLTGIIVKEAETEPFLVMDRRKNLYKKRYPPSLSDEVWRLKEISRGSPLHKRLMDANINTVAEFLRSLNMNPHSLKQILKVSAEKFKVIIEHAKTCLIGKHLYLYNSTSCERKARVVFNVVGCLRGLLYEDKYVPVDKLSEDEKVDAHIMMESAFEHLDDAESIENEASITHLVSRSPNSNGANTSSSLRSNNAAGSDFSPEIVVPTFEDVEPIGNEASISHFAPVSKASGGNISSFPRTENAASSNFSPEITFEDVEHRENEASITHLASGSSNANAANTSSDSRTESVAGSNFGIWHTNDDSDNALLPSTLQRHLSPIYSFGRDVLDFLPANNLEICGHGTDYPSYSGSASEEFGDHVQLFIEEHSFQRNTAGNMQIGTRIASSSVARQRWQMAISVVALGDVQARKKQRLK